MFQLDLLCHTGILGVDGCTNWDLVFCWVGDFGPKRPFPYDWRLANENDENEHSLQQVDNVIENKIFPDFVSATDPRQDEAKKFREPSDAHNDKNLKNHFEVVAVSLSARRNPKLFACAQIGLCQSPCLVQLSWRKHEKDKICSLKKRRKSMLSSRSNLRTEALDMIV